MYHVVREGDARNFNVNAAPGKTGSYPRVGVRSSAAAADVNVNRNASGDPETAAVDATAAADARRESVVDENRRKSVPGGRKSSAAAPPDDLLESQSSVSGGSDADEARRRRSKAASRGDQAGEQAGKAKAKASRLRLCVRRCIADDETWDLQTVPDLDMLVVKHIADNYACMICTVSRKQIPRHF